MSVGRFRVSVRHRRCMEGHMQTLRYTMEYGYGYGVRRIIMIYERSIMPEQSRAYCPPSTVHDSLCPSLPRHCSVQQP